MDRRLARIIKLIKEEMVGNAVGQSGGSVSYTHLRAHET